MSKNQIKGALIVTISVAIVIVFRLWYNTSEKIDFSADIKPILNKNCISCHGGVTKNGGFSLLFEEEALGNTKAGRPAIVAGNALGSEFIKRINSNDPELRMPYKKPKLSDKDIATLTKWINQGAKWGDHWAYSWPENNVVEKPLYNKQENSFIQNGIDHFILDKIQQNKLEPNKEADKNILGRRLALDIVGIPLTEEENKVYTSNKISTEELVDGLLEKPLYGEKWASWWLDMARFADSKGYEKDASRTIWSYRDWVIKSFNEDMPFDQFTKEQLAGDLFENPTEDQLIATAFHRNTMNNDEGGTEDEEFRVAAVMDRVNTTFEVWQSTTIGCVQCHSHPYDPFLQKDYYEIMAFFNNSRDEDIPSERPNYIFYNEKQQVDVDKVLNWINEFGDEETNKSYKDFLTFQEPVYHAHSAINFNNGVYDNHAAFSLWDDGSCEFENVYTQNSSYIYFMYNARYNGTKMIIKENDANGPILAEFTINKTKGSKIHKFQIKKIDRKVNLYFETNNDNVKKETGLITLYWMAFLKDLPGSSKKGYTSIIKTFDKLLSAKTPKVPIMVENPDFMQRTTQVFDRGNWLMKTDTVRPSTPDILNDWNEAWPNNRLGLANWLVDKKNPLTARTLVNRVWQQLFGEGLVTTVEDLGSQSPKPTHPELLDWLSIRFMNEHNWSIKSLIKEIVLSGTYQQSSESTPQEHQQDPFNLLYARGPRIRLSAEQIRDQALAVSGLLSSKMYGPSVMPPQPDGVWQTVYNSDKWVVSKGEDKYRRAVYTYLKRTSPYPSYLTFDAGSREVCTVKRTTTNTPLQALITLNDPVYTEAALAFAKKIDVSNSIENQITQAYEMALNRRINEETLKTLFELYSEVESNYNSNPESVLELLKKHDSKNTELAVLTVVVNAIMNLDEFLTKA